MGVMDYCQLALMLVVMWMGTCSSLPTEPYPIEFGFTAPAVELDDFIEEVIEGDTAPFAVIEKVVSYSKDDKEDMIVLRNLGGQAFDLTGWKLLNEKGENPYHFGEGPFCVSYSSIKPSQKLIITLKTRTNPCGFSFGMNTRGEINLIDPEGKLTANVGWDQSYKGMVIQRGVDGQYKVLNERSNLMKKLETLGNFKYFLQALNVTGLSKFLTAESNPDYDPEIQHEEEVGLSVVPQFPSHFGYAFNRSNLEQSPVKQPPPAKEGIPEMGPYTVFAPTDTAFKQLQAQITGRGEEPAPIEFIMNLPELRDILLYHIAPGLWTSEYLVNNTAVVTSKASEVVPFVDGSMGEGKILLHDSCIDKPTPDGIPCTIQKSFGKCMEPFMSSPLSAQWIGGFCQRSCSRCSCDLSTGSSCAEVLWPDVMASNGVIHSVSRLLFPPPIFPTIASAEDQSNAGQIKDRVSKTVSDASRREASILTGGLLVARSTRNAVGTTG